MKPSKAYEALLEKSIETGLPLAYRNDLLIHDKKRCEEQSDGEPFVWILRDTGTAFISASASESNTKVLLSWKIFIESLQDSLGTQYKFFTWNGIVLSEISANGATAFLWEQLKINGGKLPKEMSK